MADRQLLVFALNTTPDIRHTNLSRQHGETETLPPLHDWLQVRSVDTDQIELFPLDDLGDMPLTTYLSQAFDIEEQALAKAAPRLNLLEGSILLVPADALDGDPKPGPEATLMAQLPVMRMDNSADLPKAAPGPARAEPPEPAAPRSTGNTGAIVVIGLALAILIVVTIALLVT